MKRVLIVFCIAWGMFSMANTGHIISQLQWLERMQFSPAGVQERAGDIFNQGAIKASRLKDLPRPEVAVLFVEDEQGLLKALPLTYWLYPTFLQPASSKYYDPNGGRVKDDVNTALALAVSKPEGKTIFYVGKISTLKRNAALLADYKQTVVSQDKQDFFVVLEKK